MKKIFFLFKPDDNDQGGGNGGEGEKPFAQVLQEVRDEYEKRLEEAENRLKEAEERHANELKDMLLNGKKRGNDGDESFAIDFAKKMKKKFGG